MENCTYCDACGDSINGDNDPEQGEPQNICSNCGYTIDQLLKKNKPIQYGNMQITLVKLDQHRGEQK